MTFLHFGVCLGLSRCFALSSTISQAAMVLPWHAMHSCLRRGGATMVGDMLAVQHRVVVVLKHTSTARLA
jgi:hypothetical protein